MMVMGSGRMVFCSSGSILSPLQSCVFGSVLACVCMCVCVHAHASDCHKQLLLQCLDLHVLSNATVCFNYFISWSLY